MSHNIAPGPIAPENNPPINAEFYQPSVFFISAITLGPTTIITTSVNHNYVIGQIVRVLITEFYGTWQISEQQGLVIAIPAPNQVTVTIDSTNANAFIANPPFGPTQPQIVAVGDQNSGQINQNGRNNNITFIQGSFINISPL